MVSDSAILTALPDANGMIREVAYRDGAADVKLSRSATPDR
jgi:hypothetical protein